MQTTPDIKPPTGQQGQPNPYLQRWRTALTTTILSFHDWAQRTTKIVRVRAAAARADESGNVITDNLAWIVFGVIITVAIAALIKTLGATVLGYVENQLGVG
jgi:hypothetical protein